MLRQIRFKNFRSFQQFTITFDDGAYLVGPNNAGKSTILTALRLANTLVRSAHSRRADVLRTDGNRDVVAYALSTAEFPSLMESIRHEFRNREARLELTWNSGSRLVAVWPEVSERSSDSDSDSDYDYDYDDDYDEEDAARDDNEPFFYLEKKRGITVRDAKSARDIFPLLGVIPALSPLEHSESLLDPSYVKRNITGRLSSRHFRNQLYLLKFEDRFHDFLDFSQPWLGDVRLDEPVSRMTDDGVALDLFYEEEGSNVPKEIVWAGDGIQVWLQILYHVYQSEQASTLVLDEPEVYLHPDLQRRLARLLRETSKQVILATHSPDFIAEIDQRYISVVDKTATSARRAAKDPATLESLTETLGTAFNLRLAKALRSRVVLFLEGQDMTIIGTIARTLGFNRIAQEENIAIVPMGGSSLWQHVPAFKWLCQEMFPDAFRVFVVLDRDYMEDSVVEKIEASLSSSGVQPHIWRRKELESYLLNVDVLTRTSKAPAAFVRDAVRRVTTKLGSEVFANTLARSYSQIRSQGIDLSTITEPLKTKFDQEWMDENHRLERAPAKAILRGLNAELASHGYSTVSAGKLASAHQPHEIPAEMKRTLHAIEEAAGPSRTYDASWHVDH